MALQPLSVPLAGHPHLTIGHPILPVVPPQILRVNPASLSHVLGIQSISKLLALTPPPCLYLFLIAALGALPQMQ